MNRPYILISYVRNIFRPFLLCLFFTFSSFSQSFSVSGNVQDEEQLPIAFANILLMAAKDSVLIDGTFTDENGAFILEDVEQGNYFLKASYLDNESALTSIVLDRDLNLETLQLSTTSKLDEVVVTHAKPTLERKVDRLVFKVENTALTDTEIWDVLKRTPSVMIINDQLSVKGSSDVGILINGRKVHLPKGDIINLLSGASASSVEAIEVITSPPAKYSAEDDILINIKMKKNLVAGYNGAIYNRYVQGILPKHTIGTDHYFKGEKMGLSVNYNFGHSRKVTKYTDITNFIDGGDITSKWVAEQEVVTRRKRHNLSAFFDYDLSDKSRLSLTAITVWQPHIHTSFDTQTSLNGDTLYSRFTSDNLSKRREINTSYYVDYEHELNEKGAEIAVNGHYTFYDQSRGQLLDTDFYDFGGNYIGKNDFTVNTEQYINLYSLRVDFSTPLGKSTKFESGLRYADIASKSIVVQQGFDQETPGVSPTEAGTFKYDESILAGYASFNTRLDKWRIKGGLRGEYTNTQGEWSQGNENRNNDYFKLFPSFSVMYIPNKNHDFIFYYNRRITRPRYSSINPFQIFQSNFSTIEGNPELMPSTNSYLAAGYTLKNTYTLEFFYKNRKNGLGQLIFQNNDLNWLRFINSNIDKNTSYGFDVIFNKEISSFWDSYVLGSFFDEKITFTNINNGQMVENQLFNWFVRSNNNFTFLEDRSLTANLSFYYTSPLLSKNSRYDSYSAIDILFRKSLWNNKASISIGVDDIFNQGNLFSTRIYQDQNSTSLSRLENRLFTAGFRYKFGNSKIKSNKKSKRVEERNRL